METAIRSALEILQKKRDQIEAAIASLRLLDETETEAPRSETKRTEPETITISHSPKLRRTETERSLSAPGHKPCKKCGAVKKLGDFPKNHACVDGHTNECKECAKERAKRAYQAKHGKAGGNGSGKLVYECHACHAKFSTQLAKANHNCVRAAAAGDF